MRGFIAFDKKSKKFSPLITKDKMPGSTQYAICVTKTKKGSIWVGGEDFILLGNSLYNRFLNTVSPAAYMEGDSVYTEFRDVAYDRKRKKYFLCISNKRELLELNEDLSISRGIPIPSSKSRPSLSSVLLDNNGRLYAGAYTAPYLFYMDGDMNTLKPAAGNLFNRDQFPVDMVVRLMVFDGKGNIWIAGNNNKLIKWNILLNTIKTFNLSVAKESGLPDKVFINDIATDSTLNVWVATSSGLFFLDNKTEKISHYYAEKKTSDNLASNFLNVVAVDGKNRIWIAPQYQGLQIFDPVKEKVVQNYSTGRGSPASHIDDITFDKQGDAWCTSNAGLIHYNSKTGLWKVFTSRDGLTKNYLTGDIQFTQHQNIFLGIDKTIFVFDPGKLPENKNRPVMHITGFDVLGKKFLTDTLPDYKRQIMLSHIENRVDISFTAIETLFPDKIKFFYRLIGLDDEWKPANNRRISFASLSPGSYTFEVKALNDDGYESQLPASIFFTIKKAYWQTAWFILLCLIAFVSFLYALYRYRVSQILKVQQVKNKLSADLHDDIGSRLTTIQMLALISKKQPVLDTKTISNLDSIGDEVQASAEALHEIVTSMRAKKESDEDMSVSMRRYAAQVFELTETNVIMEIQDDLPVKKMKPEKRRELFLIYKEILNNTRKHAGAKNVRIAVRREDKNLLLNISDDGYGFDTTASTTRNGLKIIKERVDKWKGKTTVTSSPGKGTAVEIIFPVT